VRPRCWTRRFCRSSIVVVRDTTVLSFLAILSILLWIAFARSHIVTLCFRFSGQLLSLLPVPFSHKKTTVLSFLARNMAGVERIFCKKGVEHTVSKKCKTKHKTRLSCLLVRSGLLPIVLCAERIFAWNCNAWLSELPTRGGCGELMRNTKDAPPVLFMPGAKCYWRPRFSHSLCGSLQSLLVVCYADFTGFRLSS